MSPPLPPSSSTNDYRNKMLQLPHLNPANFYVNQFVGLYRGDDSDFEDDTILDYSSTTIYYGTSTMETLNDHSTEYFGGDESLTCYSESDGRVSLAYEKLKEIPVWVAENFANHTHTLDLSFNNIKDLSFLVNFKVLKTLILDKNEAPNEATFPYLPELQILWLNNCNIFHMTNWINRLQACCPNLRQLSLLGNPGISSTFNGGTAIEHFDYRMYVISLMPQLQYLDDTMVTDGQRAQAQTHKSAYALNGGPMKFVETFGSSNVFVNFFRSERNKHHSATTTTTAAATTGRTVGGRYFIATTTAACDAICASTDSSSN